MEEQVVRLCEQSVERLHGELGTREVSCLLRDGDVLRNVAHAGRLRVIYEIPRDWGGVIWRAAERAETQLVKDVKSDPEYLSQDESVRAEIAVPITVGRDVVAVLNVECQEGLDEGDREVVEREAKRLALSLEDANASARRS